MFVCFYLPDFNFSSSFGLCIQRCFHIRHLSVLLPVFMSLCLFAFLRYCISVVFSDPSFCSVFLFCLSVLTFCSVFLSTCILKMFIVLLSFWSVFNTYFFLFTCSCVHFDTQVSVDPQITISTPQLRCDQLRPFFFCLWLEQQKLWQTWEHSLPLGNCLYFFRFFINSSAFWVSLFCLVFV